MKRLDEPPLSENYDLADITAKVEEGDVLPELPTAGSTTPLRTLAHRKRYAREPEVPDADSACAPPPSFAQSEFETIVRRQRNNQPHTLKIPNIPSRFPNLDNLWEFAGWGSMSYIELTEGDLAAASDRLAPKEHLLTALQASSIAGNDMYGSVFYAFPVVAAVCGALSPIALLLATLLLFLFRPILLELGSAIRFNGAIYVYLLQCSGKSLALIGAAAMFLDAVATASTSAATVSAYLAGELRGRLHGMGEAGVAIGIIIVLACVGLANVKESSAVTLSFTIIHLATMLALVIASIAAWVRSSSTEILAANWALLPSSGREAFKQLFFGTCLAFLGVTGFETAPTYIEHIPPKSYKTTLSTCIYTVVSLNAPLMLFIYALLPQDHVLSGGNVLSALAETVAGKWLRYIVVVDCVLVVGGGGVLAGLVAICGMLQKLAKDRVIPPVFERTLQNGSPHWAILFFVFMSIALYATSGFSLANVSAVFSVAFLVVLGLYALANILLKFNRDRLPRSSRTSLAVSVLALLAILVVLVGNVVQSPIIVLLFAAYFFGILICLHLLKSRIPLARVALWLYDQLTVLHKSRFSKGWNGSIVTWMARLRRYPVVVWVKNDNIYDLVEAVLYVKRNEVTSKIIFIHVYDVAVDIPSELEANVKILDEAFPSITLDLIFVKGCFNPTLVEAISIKLEVHKNQMCMNTMGSDHGFQLADYGGVRVANL